MSLATSPTAVKDDSIAASAEDAVDRSFPLGYLLAGVWFGIVLVKSEAVSWYRIQEMFRFQAFHMYGLIGSAVATGAISLLVMRRLKVRSRTGEEVHVPDKTLGRGLRYILGGIVFGLGWGLVGTCPGPMYALLGAGFTVMIVVLTGGVLGTWTYGVLADRLPH